MSEESKTSETDKWIQYAIALFPQSLTTIQRNNRQRASRLEFVFSINLIPADKDETL